MRKILVLLRKLRASEEDFAEFFDRGNVLVSSNHALVLWIPAEQNFERRNDLLPRDAPRRQMRSGRISHVGVTEFREDQLGAPGLVRRILQASAKNIVEPGRIGTLGSQQARVLEIGLWVRRLAPDRSDEVVLRVAHHA